MSNDLIFLPIPKKIFEKAGLFNPSTGQYIQIDDNNPQKLLFTAEQIKTTFATNNQASYSLTASQSIPADQIAIKIKIDPGISEYLQAYQLTINPVQILITGSDEAGLLYGVQTLRQIVSQRGSEPLPCLEISIGLIFQSVA